MYFIYSIQPFDAMFNILVGNVGKWGWVKKVHPVARTIGLGAGAKEICGMRSMNAVPNLTLSECYPNYR